MRTGFFSPTTSSLRFCNDATAVLPLLNGLGITSFLPSISCYECIADIRGRPVL